jgi:hypothetical protein
MHTLTLNLNLRPWSGHHDHEVPGLQLGFLFGDKESIRFASLGEESNIGRQAYPRSKDCSLLV